MKKVISAEDMAFLVMASYFGGDTVCISYETCGGIRKDLVVDKENLMSTFIAIRVGTLSSVRFTHDNFDYKYSWSTKANLFCLDEEDHTAIV